MKVDAPSGRGETPFPLSDRKMPDQTTVHDACFQKILRQKTEGVEAPSAPQRLLEAGPDINRQPLKAEDVLTPGELEMLAQLCSNLRARRLEDHHS